MISKYKPLSPAGFKKTFEAYFRLSKVYVLPLGLFQPLGNILQEQSIFQLEKSKYKLLLFTILADQGHAGYGM